MNRLRKIISILAVTALVFSCGKSEEVTEKVQNEDAIIAAVSFLAGNVRRERDGSLESLSVGDFLKPADILITGENSEADLSLKGYGIMKIGSSTRIRVLELSKSSDESQARMGLEQGQVVSLINRKDSRQNYEIVTPTAVAGVRGTVFLTSVTGSQEKPEVKVAVLSGSVAVNAGDSEVVLSEGTQMVVDENRRISRDMVKPLGEDSLKEIKRLSVFHRTNVFEYNSMMEEIRQVTPELKELEGADSAEASMERRSARDARMENDTVQRAQRVDLSRHIKRDTEGDPIKLEPGSGFE